MWYFKEDQIKDVHFEISNYCNAACPECPREDISEIDPSTGINRFSSWIDTAFLSLDVIQKNFNKTHTPSLQSIAFCGCFGDALTHPKLIDILEYFIKEFPKISISISSNGGLKTTNYWIRLAETLKKSYYHEVIWGLDGLEDTNHLYRVNVKWDKVRSNWQAFNKAGGNSVWQFIVFPHNHHQIVDAKKYAKKEGFSGFTTVISMRYSETKAKDLPERFQHPKIKDNSTDTFILKRNNRVLLPEYTKIMSTAYNNIDKSTNKLVECSSQQRHSVFVFSDGTLWPCSKLGAWKNPANFKSAIIEKETNARHNNSLYHYSIDKVMANNYFGALKPTHSTGNFCTACTEECGKIGNTNLFQTLDVRSYEEI